MSAVAFEAFLARLYVDAGARARFLADPTGEARRAGLDEAQRRALADIDVVGLELAAASFARKRAGNGGGRRGVRARARAWLARWR